MWQHRIVDDILDDWLFNEILNWWETAETRRGFDGRTYLDPTTKHTEWALSCAIPLPETFNAEFETRLDPWNRQTFVIQDEPNWSLKPQTNLKDAAFIIYLNQCEVSLLEGEPVRKSKLTPWECYEDQETVVTMQPNSLLYFPCTEHSWHGVRPCKGVRKTIQHVWSQI